MELSNLTFSPLKINNTTRLLVPFIIQDKSLVSTESTDFFNAFIGDVNRPWLEDKVFLVYKSGGTLNLIRQKLEDNIYFHSYYWISMDGEYYNVFVFNIPTEYIKQTRIIRDGNATLLDVSTRMKITNFWNKNEYNIYNLLNSKYVNNRRLLVEDDLIKEEDLVIDDIQQWLSAA